MNKITRTPTGHRCGESHQNTKISDETVRAIRARHIPYVRGYKALSVEFGCGESTIRDICTYRTRITA